MSHHISHFNHQPSFHPSRELIAISFYRLQKFGIMAYLHTKLLAFVALLAASNAFVSHRATSPKACVRSSGRQQLHLFDTTTIDFVEAAAHSMWLATIDGDIDSIPNNEFGTIFAGGIVSVTFHF